MNRNVLAITIVLSLFSRCFSMEREYLASQISQDFDTNESNPQIELQLKYHISNLYDITDKVLEMDKNKIRYGSYGLSQSDRQDLTTYLNICTKYLRVKSLNKPYEDLLSESYSFLMVCKKTFKLWESLYNQEKIAEDLFETYRSSILSFIVFADRMIDNEEAESQLVAKL